MWLTLKRAVKRRCANVNFNIKGVLLGVMRTRRKSRVYEMIIELNYMNYNPTLEKQSLVRGHAVSERDRLLESVREIERVTATVRERLSLRS